MDFPENDADKTDRTDRINKPDILLKRDSGSGSRLHNTLLTSATISTAKSATTNTIQTGLGPVTDKIISDLLDKFTIEKYQDRINDGFIDPLTQLVNQRLKPYVYFGGVLYIINVGLLLLVIYLLLSRKRIY
jgi:hypothetical protein